MDQLAEPAPPAAGKNRAMNSPLDIIVPILMCAALLWWIGRGMSMRAMLLATAVTLAVVAGVLFVQNTGWR